MKINIGVSNRDFLDKILKKQSEIFNLMEEQNLSVSSLNFICQNDELDSIESNCQKFNIVPSEKYSLKTEESKDKLLKFLKAIENCLDS